MKRRETTEQLTSRLDAVQEKILAHFETTSTELAAHIEYWSLVRQESVILYYARHLGVNRLGLQPVPAQAISEGRAKQAIGMQLVLESLQRSPYAREEWTLQDVSLEKYSVQPKNTFKKDGTQVHVKYGPDPTDFMPYVLWGSIYYQDVDDKWHKVPGQVDYHGLFYMEGKEKIYYENFKEDAIKFGMPGRWIVNVKNTAVPSFSRQTSSAFAGGRPGADSTDAPEAPSTSRWSPRASNTTQAQESNQVSGPSTRRGRGRRSPSPGEGPSSSRRRRLPTAARRTPSPERHSRSRSRDWRGGRGGGGGLRGRGRQGESAGRSAGPHSRSSQSPAPTPPTPGQVGGRHRTAEPGASRLERLIQEARDPPVVLIRGTPNGVKCLRYRLRTQNQHLYDSVTSTFFWVNKNGKQQEGRIMLSFTGTPQRTHFLSVFKVPKGMSLSLGRLDAL
ncbi:putative E2 early protein [Eptesicus serotinus papillomavirus 2]|uniref:Regulatory protein E2 n=1 Tax=Eptesicus serotinus papillomavirus 2 TaxID=1464072 RepID=W8EH55_9PAPI|nr:putative E2 early protein [Eptesicus serotinus papillomavirus 2]AHJ81393.1 putative E2 early protein [Eptesicus serotinus papillomavirus 2]